MEVTSWNLHHGSYFIELSPCKLRCGTYNFAVTSLNLNHRIYLMELTKWKEAHGVQTTEVT